MGMCKFWKECKLYSKHSVTCVKNDGMYSYDWYGSTPAACYIRMEKKKNELKAKET